MPARSTMGNGFTAGGDRAMSHPQPDMNLTTFDKLPLGGVDRRALPRLMRQRGPTAARALLREQLARITPAGAAVADDAVVLILGGSNGITRALALQLVFGESAAVYCVHYDPGAMRIGAHHADALMEAASNSDHACRMLNADATRAATIERVVGELVGRYRVVHLVNGIAAGATKRYAEHGATTVRDLDMAFDPVLQVPQFNARAAYRKLGQVAVEVATAAEIERTNKLMGHSSWPWCEALRAAGLLVAGESTVSFCDFDFEPDDPVYGMGPLAGAKKLQRQSMKRIATQLGVRTVRLCYPAMATTALGAIPGGCLMYALSAQILHERGCHRSIAALGRDTMELWRSPAPSGELRMDADLRAARAELHRREAALRPADVPECFSALLD